MKIVDHLRIKTEQMFAVVIKHNRKEYVLDILMTDGKVLGDERDNIRTSKLVYFDLPLRTRKLHFKQLKNYLEKNNN